MLVFILLRLLLLPLVASCSSARRALCKHGLSERHHGPLGHLRALETEKSVILPKITHQGGSLGLSDS